MRQTLVAACLVGLCAGVMTSALAAPGDTLRSLPAPYVCPQGLAYDGHDLWCVDRRTDQIYRLDPQTGVVRDSIPSPGYMPRGLTWDGTWLWCVDGGVVDIGGGMLYAINPLTRIVERTIESPVSDPGDLAWDGAALWIVDNGLDKIHRISAEDGTTIVSLTAPTGNPAGLTFDGTYLWVSDRNEDKIFAMTTTGGDVVAVCPAPGPHSWGLAWDGQSLWNVDYQTDRIYCLKRWDGTPYTRLSRKTETMEFVDEVRNYGPDTVLTLDVYYAVPADRDNQEMLAPIRFTPEPLEVIADKWGQKVAHFRFENVPPARSVTVTMNTAARLHEVVYCPDPRTIGTVADCPPDIRKAYLVDDAKFALQDPVIQKAMREAVGNETNAYWIARKIYNYVIEHIEYERVGGWNIAPAVLQRGSGSCSEYTFVYVALCRAAGLPARYVGSIVVRGDDASYDDVFHRWAEVYLPNFGWMPVDPSGGDSPSPAGRAAYFGHVRDRYLITTAGGGGSEYLEWGYNANARWTSRGRCKVAVENYGEWSPAPVTEK